MVNVIIVNYKGWKDTIECLESILKSDYTSITIFVVDNSEDSVSIEKLEDWALGRLYVENSRYNNIIKPFSKKPLGYKIITEDEFIRFNYDEEKILFIKSDNNKGFAAANNIVLKRMLNSSHDSFIFLLNNDTVIQKSTIRNFVYGYEKVPNIGIAGGVLLEYSDGNVIQSVGGKYNYLFGLTKQVFENKEINDLPLDHHLEIDYPVGAAMFLSTTILKETGLMNEEYFLYFEELDWVSRNAKKYTTTYLDNCYVYHKGGASIESQSKSFLSDKYSLINRIKFAKRYNRRNLIFVYIGVYLSILRRLLNLKFKRSYFLLKEVHKS